MKLTRTGYIIAFLISFLVLSNTVVYPQSTPYFVKSYPDTLHKKRLRCVLVSQGAIFAGTLGILYQAWYKNYPMNGFHWFDDGGEWLQMDKIGHATTSAYLGKWGYEFYRYAGVSRKKAIWLGGSAGFLYLSMVEILDGFSAEWGASPTDLLANATGAALFIGQQLGWDEQRFYLKWSYHPTEFAKYRPDLLGSGGFESMLKDYNGQTYWLSGNIKSFIRNKDSKFPAWLNIAVGYGGTGMLGAYSNPPEHNGEPLPEYQRVRQYYLSLDIDLSRIKTRHTGLNFLLNFLGFVKFPFPALEYNKENGFVFHPLYF